jgi:hypothetical protein
LPPALPGPYARPPAADALRPAAATVALVRDQVQGLLLGSASFQQLAPERRRALARDLVKVAAYAAECVRDDWFQSEKMGQRPLVVRGQRGPVASAAAGGMSEAAAGEMSESAAGGPVATAADQRPGADFTPGAANRIGQVTRQTLDAIAFPTFVAELIRGTFDAITNAGIKQMEAYARLLGDVGKTVDDFMNQNISDNQARDWLAQSYPMVLRVQVSGGPSPSARGRGRGSGRGHARSSAASATARLVPVDGAEERPLPNWRADLGVSGRASLDEEWLESQLVPAARRKLAQTRLQVLSTMVLMGMNRIAVTAGKIRATMAFHIDTSDAAHEEHATDIDFRTAASGSFGFGPWSASASVSFAYVTSSRSTADSEMHVGADLTSEVEIHFKSEAFPLERMALPGQINQIQNNTPVPAANAPVSSTGEPIAWGPDVQRSTVPVRERPAPSYRPAGSPLPPAPAPAAPAAPARPAPAAGGGGGSGDGGRGAVAPAGGGAAAPAGGGAAAPAGGDDGGES